jgi:hypothetical protein
VGAVVLYNINCPLDIILAFVKVVALTIKGASPVMLTPTSSPVIATEVAPPPTLIGVYEPTVEEKS